LVKGNLMAIIGVMGSGAETWAAFAAPLGKWIAQNGHDLLTGAGNGVMRCAAQAFSSTAGRRGRSIGIVPSRPDAAKGFAALDGYPNPFIDLRILTPLPRKEAGASPDSLSRNHVNVLTSDVLIALPGGPGTLDEISLAVRFAKPVMCLGPGDAFMSVQPGIPMSTQLEDAYRFISAHLA
jgi:uncharacterized protein (TIGR00725 family)